MHRFARELCFNPFDRSIRVELLLSAQSLVDPSIQLYSVASSFLWLIEYDETAASQEQASQEQ